MVSRYQMHPELLNRTSRLRHIDSRPSEDVLRQKIQNRWVDLNNDDLAYIDASRDRLIERLKVRYHMTGEQAQKQVTMRIALLGLMRVSGRLWQVQAVRHR